MNGKLAGLDEAKVPLLTHSLHYGSAAFEGIRFYRAEKGAALFRLGEHYRRISRNSTDMSVKLSGNYINSLLAGLEARKKGFHEALLLDESGNVAEG